MVSGASFKSGPQTPKISNAAEAVLSEANMRIAEIAGVDINGANLLEANLSGANLTGADLTDARLEGANLTGADLTEAKGMTSDQVAEAITNAATRRLPTWPARLRRLLDEHRRGTATVHMDVRLAYQRAPMLAGLLPGLLAAGAPLSPADQITGRTFSAHSIANSARYVVALRWAIPPTISDAYHSSSRGGRPRDPLHPHKVRSQGRGTDRRPALNLPVRPAADHGDDE
jgi:hypothetical protein